MASRYVDSFDTYTTILQRWTASVAGSIVAAAARTGVAGLRDPNNTLTLTAQGTWIYGSAYRTSALAQSDILATIDGGVNQGQVRINAAGTISVLRGVTVVATSALSIITNVFNYFEFKHIIANAAGTLEVRVNGAVWATFAGDTQETANPTADQLGIRGIAAGTEDFDDLYIFDGTGAINNDYAGVSQIEALVPSGAGNYTEFTTLVGAATHWQAVNEVPPNEDTSYVEATVLNQRDTFAFGNVSPASATIPCVQVSMRARMTAAGALNIARMYRSGVTDNQGANVALTTSYVSILEIMETDPIAVGAWTVALVNAGEWGARAT